MKRHVLKCKNPYFTEIWDEQKTFELRRDDRGFAVGDELILREIDDDEELTGQYCYAEVTSILREFPGLESGYCIMSILLHDRGDETDEPEDAA